MPGEAYGMKKDIEKYMAGKDGQFTIGGKGGKIEVRVETPNNPNPPGEFMSRTAIQNALNSAAMTPSMTQNPNRNIGKNERSMDRLSEEYY